MKMNLKLRFRKSKPVRPHQEAQQSKAGTHTTPYGLMLDDLRKSGLVADDAKRLQLRPYSTKESEVLNLPRGADAGYKIPYFDSRGKLLSMFRYRYFKTVSDSGFTAGAELRRYDQPDNTPVEIYLPRGYVDWDEIELLIVTEGEKKAACATKNGFPCIGLGGVWSFGRGKGDRRLHKTLTKLAWVGRVVHICFDSDVAKNPDIMRAENRVARELVDAGAVVHVDRIPPDGPDKVGLDNYIVAHGKEAFRKLLDGSRVWEDCQHLHELNAQYVICRKPASIYEIDTFTMYSKQEFVGILEAPRKMKETVPPDEKRKARTICAAREWVDWPRGIWCQV